MKSSISASEKINMNNVDRPVYLDKTEVEIENMSTREIESYIKKLPLSSIGVSVIPEAKMLARQSYSLTNYMNSSESGDYFTSYYQQPLERFMGTLGSDASIGQAQKLIKDSQYRMLAMLKLKNINPDVTIEDMQQSPQGLENLGHHLQLAALGGDTKMLGNDVLINTIKSKFLDPLLSPASVDRDGVEYGGKFVLKQSFKHRDLEPTIRDGEGKDAKIYHGEVMLPGYAGEGQINFKDPNMIMKALNKKR